jgi:DnaJ-class molecular chaperone
MNSVECPLCWGEGRLCKSQTTDPGGCPKRSENLGCDGCEESAPCSLCKGEGYVSQAKLNRWYEEMAEIRWGECKPNASEMVEKE